MNKKRAPEIKEEIIKQNTHGQAIAGDGKDPEIYLGTSYTSAGDRVTPYKADEDLGEKGNMQE